MSGGRPLWKEVKDTSSGLFYYYNRQTKETTWTNPYSAATPSGEEETIPAGADAEQSTAPEQEMSPTPGPPLAADKQQKKKNEGEAVTTASSKTVSHRDYTGE